MQNKPDNSRLCAFNVWVWCGILRSFRHKIFKMHTCLLVVYLFHDCAAGSRRALKAVMINIVTHVMDIMGL